MKHTPGPWKHVPNTGVVRYDGTDKDIGSVHICGVGDYRDKELLPFNKERWDADATLIAAAPKMFAALNAVSKLIAEAAMTGFNCHDGDWAQRLYDSQQETSAALRDAVSPPQTLSNEGEKA